MVVHFETLWENAELLTAQETISAEEVIKQIEEQLRLLQSDSPIMHEYHMGEVIFNLCKVSRILNINTYLALQKTITDKKSEILEKTI